jgi:hypothetical protein
MGSAQNSFSLGTTILASAVGFCFGVLGIVVSQWYQRRLERGTLCDVLLTEILDILERLEAYESLL